MSIVHVVNDESIIEQKRSEIKESIDTLMDGKQIPIHVIAGDITTDISLLAKELNSKLIIIGTHVNPSKGISHLFGSHTMKVVISTHTPILLYFVKRNNLVSAPKLSSLQVIIISLDSGSSTS